MEGVSVRYTDTTPDLFAGWLKQTVYENQTGVELLTWPLAAWGFLSFLFVIAAAIFTKKKRKAARRGERIRGPETMSVRQFNRSQGWEKKGFALAVKPTEERHERD